MTASSDGSAIGLARRPLANVRAAVSFLTRLPIGGTTIEPDRTGAAAFAVVGASIGLVGAIPVVVLGPRLPLPAAVLALLVMVLLSGGLHLDGLGDTADALAAPTPDAAERARTDPRAGAAGVAAITLDLLLAASLLAEITAADAPIAAAALVVAGAASRALAPIAAWTIGSGRKRRQLGLGGWFGTRVSTVDVAAATTTTVVVIALATVALGANTIWLGALAGVVIGAVSSAAVVARRGQLDGDGYGAIIEVTFVAVLAGIAALSPIS